MLNKNDAATHGYTVGSCRNLRLITHRTFIERIACDSFSNGVSTLWAHYSKEELPLNGFGRTCELGMNLATGKDYQSVIFLLEELTRPHNQGEAAVPIETAELQHG